MSFLGLASAVNWRAKVVIFMQESQTDDGGALDTLAEPVLLPVVPDGIETLQSETRRINLVMASRTRFH